MSIKSLNDKLSKKTNDEICDYLNKPYHNYFIKILLGKKYYLMAIDKGCSEPINNLKKLEKIIVDENKKKFFEKINNDDMKCEIMKED
jgi:hypothetical protein